MYPHYLHNTRSLEEVLASSMPPHGDKQVVEIILLKDELLHDIESAVRDVQDGLPPERPALLPSDGKDSYLLMRHLDSAVNQAVSRCQAYLLLPSPFVHRISTDHVRGWEEKSIILGLPHNWPPHCIGSLRDAVHNYIVYQTCALFLALKEPKSAEACGTMAYSFYNDINTHLNSRLGPMNIHPSFLG